MGLLTTLLAAAAISGAVYEEFNSMDELKENWWISRWGQTAKQYDTNHVAVEDSVLKLTMTPDSLDGNPRPLCGEVTYTSAKFLYGSFRASIKTTEKSGGVVGWFVYKDGVPGDGNLHEIDMEILTEDLTQIHYTLHHDEYSVAHKIHPLSFDPSADFHEYRFDWYPDSVVYFIDGERRELLTTQVPDDSVQIMLNWWSNNNAYWGGDMPDTVTHMWVDYMHYLPLEAIDPTAQTDRFVKSKQYCSRIIAGSSQLNITPSMTGPVELSVYSPSGRELISQSIQGESVVNHSLSRGTYLVQMRGRAGTEVQKIVVR